MTLIAELSGNHGGSLYKAQEMVMAAKWAGAHAVKLQLYGTSCLPDYDSKVNFPICGWFENIVRFCASQKIKLVVSVFSWWGLGEALRFPLYAYKLASPESTRLPADTYQRLARRTAECNCRLWVASGHKDMDFMRSLNPDLLFFCPPGHPAILEEKDLGYLAYSDHTAGIISTLAMVKSGAQFIEKHFKLDDNCVDAAFSINPDQMKQLCDLAR